MQTAYLNGEIYTGARPAWATALIVDDESGRLLAVGDDDLTGMPFRHRRAHLERVLAHLSSVERW